MEGAEREGGVGGGGGRVCVCHERMCSLRKHVHCIISPENSHTGVECNEIDDGIMESSVFNSTSLTFSDQY